MFNHFLTQTLLFSLLGLVAFSGCKNKKNKNETLLSDAQSLLENDPGKALVLLDSIKDPDTLMDEDSYMEYIVARTEAKFKNGQSIKDDTLIVKAAKFFKIHNSEKAASAHFYAGNMYGQQNSPENAFEYYARAANFAKENKDLLLQGKSMYNIGYQYYIHNLNDSTIVYWQKASQIFQDINVKPLLKEILYGLGLSYIMSKQYEEAKSSLNNALAVAEEIKDTAGCLDIVRALGTTYRLEEKYDSASQCFHKVLAHDKTSQDSLRTFLSLTRLHVAKNQIDSLKQINLIIKDKLSSIKDERMLRDLYKNLAYYHKTEQDYEKALYYSEQEKELTKIIDANIKIAELLQADKNTTLEMYKIQENKSKIYIIYICLGVLFMIFVVLLFYRSKLMKETDLLSDEINRLKKVSK